MKRILLTLSLCVSFSSFAMAGGDAERGKALSSTCAACHGADGNSLVPLWPKLAGQNPGYLVEQIKLFQKGKDGGRYDATMQPVIEHLSEQDIEDLAAYFASQRLKVGKTDPNLADKGKKLFLGGDLSNGIPACGACHGPQGLGAAQAGFPRIGGQHSQYIISSLLKYKNGERNTDMQQMMQDIAKRLSPEDMKAVASYAEGIS